MSVLEAQEFIEYSKRARINWVKDWVGSCLEDYHNYMAEGDEFMANLMYRSAVRVALKARIIDVNSFSEVKGMVQEVVDIRQSDKILKALSAFDRAIDERDISVATQIMKDLSEMIEFHTHLLDDYYSLKKMVTDRFDVLGELKKKTRIQEQRSIPKLDSRQEESFLKGFNTFLGALSQQVEAGDIASNSTLNKLYGMLNTINMMGGSPDLYRQTLELYIETLAGFDLADSEDPIVSKLVNMHQKLTGILKSLDSQKLAEA